MSSTLLCIGHPLQGKCFLENVVFLCPRILHWSISAIRSFCAWTLVLRSLFLIFFLYTSFFPWRNAILFIVHLHFFSAEAAFFFIWHSVPMVSEELEKYVFSFAFGDLSGEKKGRVTELRRKLSIALIASPNEQRKKKWKRSVRKHHL